ncbi:hypothetical protein KFU94_35425 [Chloroflexi bacterium TSY]|nr:hypothetical protein [Chloroflexi bacterium TSY]
MLAVNGTITAQEIVVTDSGWADFVFAGDYNLMPLPEVQQYIDDNGHLPGVPSANEVDENGVDLGKMQVTLLQKIEELTLYVINQDQELALMRRELSELKAQNELLQEQLSVSE